jgi:hypothetical protein
LYDELGESFGGLDVNNVFGLAVAAVDVGADINQRVFYLAAIGYSGKGKIL